jgi:hypothetical protein
MSLVDGLDYYIIEDALYRLIPTMSTYSER